MRGAASLWWRFLPALGFWFLVGQTINTLGAQVSTMLGGSQRLLATIVFVVGVVVWVACLVLMVQSLEPGIRAFGLPDQTLPGTLLRGQTKLQVLTFGVGPFIAVYSAWNLVEDQLRILFQANLAMHPGDPLEWSVNFSQWQFYLGVAIGAFVVRFLLRIAARQRPATVLLLLGLVAEGTWIFALFVVIGDVVASALAWFATRQVWTWLVTAWDGLIGHLPDWHVWVDLTLPDAVREIGRQFWSFFAPGFGNAVLLPLMWVALTATVFGWREFRAREALGGTRFERFLAERHGVVPTVAEFLTRDVREKYVPVLQALRLLAAAGVRFVGAYLVVAAGLTLVWQYVSAGLEWLIGPQSVGITIGYSPLQDLVVGFFSITTSLALYAAAFDRCLTAATVGVNPRRAASDDSEGDSLSVAGEASDPAPARVGGHAEAT